MSVVACGRQLDVRGRDGLLGLLAGVVAAAAANADDHEHDDRGDQRDAEQRRRRRAAGACARAAAAACLLARLALLAAALLFLLPAGHAARKTSGVRRSVRALALRARRRGGARLPALVDEVGDLVGEPLGREPQLEDRARLEQARRWAARRRACRRRRTGGRGRAGGRSRARASANVRRSPRCGRDAAEEQALEHGGARAPGPGARCRRTKSSSSGSRGTRLAPRLDEPHQRLAERSARASAA